MNKHTQGPWTNGGEGRSIGRNEEMTFIFAATQENVTKKEQRANVRLACAAPDLLAALEEIVCDIESYCEDWNSDSPTDVTVALPKLRRALAMARGE